MPDDQERLNWERSKIQSEYKRLFGETNSLVQKLNIGDIGTSAYDEKAYKDLQFEDESLSLSEKVKHYTEALDAARPSLRDLAYFDEFMVKPEEVESASMLDIAASLEFLKEAIKIIRRDFHPSPANIDSRANVSAGGY